jgi:hypothetical protein
VRIRIFWTNAGGSVVKDAVVPLDRRNGSDPSFPYYAVVDLDTFFPSCNPFSLHTPCLGMDTRIELSHHARHALLGLRFADEQLHAGSDGHRAVAPRCFCSLTA